MFLLLLFATRTKRSTFVKPGWIRAAPFSLRASAYPTANAHPCDGLLWGGVFGGSGGGLNRGFSFRPAGGSAGHFGACGAAECLDARATAPVTGSVAKVACWPAARAQGTLSAGPEAGAGVGVDPPLGPPGTGVGEVPGTAVSARPGPPGTGVGEVPGTGVSAWPGVSVI